MTHVQLQFGDEARHPMLKGAEKLAKAVRATLGPWGRNVSIRRGVGIPPMITKDGVSAATKITSLPDPFEDMGLQILKEASQRTNRIAGDGTTTATVLGFDMMKLGLEVLQKGANPIHLKRGMQKACDAVCAKLESMKKEVNTLEDLKAIATISSQDEEIGSMVAMVVDEVGKDGAIQVEAGMSTGIEYEITSGMQIPVGYASPYFANQRNGNALIRNPYILVTTEKIVSIQTLLPVIQALKEHDSEARLVIFSTGIEGDAFATLVSNLPHRMSREQLEGQEGLDSLVLKPPFYGQRQLDVLEDIAIATGARLIDKKAGHTLNNIKVEDFGRSESVAATAFVTTIVGLAAKESAREQRIEIIKADRDAATEDGDRDYLSARLANITGKIAKIKVGGSSQTEQLEKQHRVEDAICAARAAKDTGILPGGGVAYLRCVLESLSIEGDKDEMAGAKIVQDVLSRQLWWVASNAGEDPEAVLDKVSKMGESEGYNAETGEYGDMFEMKVIDPTKVPITALKNAVSVASMFLTLEVGVAEEDVAPVSA